jgi:hypothetical protein
MAIIVKTRNTDLSIWDCEHGGKMPHVVIISVSGVLESKSGPVLRLLVCLSFDSRDPKYEENQVFCHT